MITTVRSELVKAATIRAVPLLAAAAVGAAALLAVVFVASLPITQGTTIAELAPTDVVASRPSS